MTIKSNFGMGSKTLIITGGTRGIGFAIAQRSLVEGYAVVIVAKTAASLDQALDDLRPFGAPIPCQVDLASKQAVLSFCQSIDYPIYGLINNAGICKVQRIDEDRADDTADIWDEVISTNLFAPYLLTSTLVDRIEDGGRIINIASQLAKEGRRGYGAYCASKFGLVGLTKCWAKELGSRGITVNAVCPGWVETEMSKVDSRRIAAEKGLELTAYLQQVTSPMELGRMSTPAEVAGLVHFLLSADGAGISGRDWLMHTIWNQE